MDLIESVLCVAWGVGTAVFAVVLRERTRRRSRLAQRAFGWSSLLTAGPMLLVELLGDQSPPRALVVIGLALAAIGAMVVLARRTTGDAKLTRG
ncbi:MAG: hypothetical protein AB1625_13545 [Acidobacteriota bacterium]